MAGKARAERGPEEPRRGDAKPGLREEGPTPEVSPDSLTNEGPAQAGNRCRGEREDIAEAKRGVRKHVYTRPRQFRPRDRNQVPSRGRD